MNEPQEAPHFNHRRAESFVGKHLLIGLTYVDHSGAVLEQKQMHGIIKAADKNKGLKIELSGKRAGEIFWLPPDLRPIEKAQPGEYRLRSTGEVVVDPDLICSWTITNQQEGNGSDA